MSKLNMKAFETNRRSLFEIMPDNSAILLESAKQLIRTGDTPYPFCQNRNFYYLTGYDNRQAAIVLKKTGNKLETHMFVIKLTPLQMHWFGYLPSPDEVKKMTGIESVRPVNDLPDALIRLLGNIETLYLDFDPISMNQTLTDSHQLAEKIRLANPHLQIRRAGPKLAQLRELKHNWEIRNIEKAIALTHSGLSRILQHMKPDVFEYELDAWFQLDLKLNKSCSSFPSIIANGKNATTLHYCNLDDTTKAGDLLLVDLGAEYQNYCADISRTFPVSGTFSEEQKRLYNIVLTANETAIKAVKPGISMTELNSITRNVLAEGLLDLGYINNPEEISNHYTHGVSHQLGLDTHDIQSGLHQTLQEGMVITIEPGIYLPKKSLGIRIEDDVVVTSDGFINLSHAIPKTVADVEQWIAKCQSSSSK